MARVKLIIFAYLLLVAFAAGAGAAEDENTEQAIWLTIYATRIVDGDTFVFVYGVDDRCRMLGYNAPEKKEDEELYGLATEKLREIIGGVDLLVYAQKRDKWNRLLCQVYLPDGTDVNKAMRAWLEEMGYKDVGKYDHMGGAR